MSTPDQPAAPTTAAPGAAAATGPAAAPPAPRPAGSRPKTPRITGGQRASAILAGIAGHILFAIGWFGIAFVILGGAFSPLVNELLANLLGDADAQRFTEILQRASAMFWLLGLVFLVGSVAFVAFGVLASLLILRRGGVDKPGRVNWTSFLIAAIVDLPVFLLVLWLATLVTDDSAGLIWLPPVLALVLSAAIGIAVWWLMAHANRGAAKPRPPKPVKGTRPAAG
ncbi:MAG: hypothetical protein BGO95_03655 [Micrococcales bacterium 73-13]|nr:MAG: hypothetical protein BGO95_03655 [Micrococcales bacterium 73-13]